MLSFVSLVVSLITIVAWCAVSFQLKPLDIATYESVIVSVLGILVTLLIGWNIYTIIDVKEVRKEMNDCIKKTKDLKRLNDTNSEKQKYLMDAYAFMGLAELFLDQNKYVNAYLKLLSSIVCFEKAGEHNLALYECKRIGLLFRNIRRHLTIEKNYYVLDQDIYNDISYGKDCAEIYRMNLEDFSIEEVQNLFNHLIINSAKYIEIAGCEFTLYARNVDLKQRPLAIYLFLLNDIPIYKTYNFDRYLQFLESKLDLNLNYDSIAIAEFVSGDKCLRVYDLIDAPEI